MPVQTVGESAKVFLSLDCFLIDIGIVGPEDTTEYLKSLWTAMLPILLFLLVSATWFSLHFIVALKISWKQVIDNIILSTIVSCFIIHPSLTNMSMGLFNCYEIEDGEFWLFKDLNVRCWHGSHPKWAYGLGIPMIVIWVFGLPIAGLIIVIILRNRL